MPNLSTKDGTPTGGVYGFAVMALEIIKRLKPDYVCVAWDKPKTNIRKRLEIYPQYKAGRKPPPEDFYVQIPILHELLDTFGWPLYELDDYEADDIMGALAEQAKKKDIDTVLITSDLDVLQLVNTHTKVYALKKGLTNIELYAPESFQAKYGIDVHQFIDLKALKGDSSDNIPGVPGVGEKTAIDLLKKYKTLEGVYENLWEISDTTRKKLESGKESAFMSKELVTLMTDAPIPLDLKATDVKQLDVDKLHEVLRKLEFRTLLRQLPEYMQVSATEQADIRKHVAEVKNIKPGKLTVIDDAKQLKDVSFTPSHELIVATRCAGKHGRDPRYIVLSPEADSVYVLDVKKLSEATVRKAIQDVLEDPKVKKVGYDIKSDIKAARSLGITLGPVGHDVLIGAFLINPLIREQSLSQLADTLGYEGTNFESQPDEDFVSTAPERIAVIHTLFNEQTQELAKLAKVKHVATDIEWPVIPVLADMEYEGIKLNGKYLEKFAVQLEDSISDLEQQIYGHADHEFNISSPTQLADVLFVKLNLPTMGVKKGKTGYSTAANELDKLRGLHPIIDLITQYREVTKLKNTYVDTLPKLVDEDSRVHTTYSLTVAQTGRLSSNDPNLQNIPVRTELGKHIRTAFVADPGKVLISADYSQFELRLAAVLAEDKELIKSFNEGIDIHAQTAAQVFGVDIDKVDSNQRRAAKVVNFGVLYGMSPHGLSVATGMTNAEAKAFIDKYFNLRKPLLTYMNHLKEFARKQGYVETIFGRRRPMPDIHSSNFVVRQAAERAAINMPIQGTEADLMKMAMVHIAEKLEDPKYGGAKMLLQIHDSILVEAPEDKEEAVSKMLDETMENVYKLPVKLSVDVHSGKNWGEL